jgi:hypothetical protein
VVQPSDEGANISTLSRISDTTPDPGVLLSQSTHVD